jgi:hypothetical protein
MGSQLVTLAALQREYETNRDGFKANALDVLLPSAVMGTALAARGEAPFRVPQRWACLAGLRVAGWLAQKTEVSVALLIAERIGAKTVDDAERLIDSARRARDANADDAYRLAKDLVRTRIASDPVERRRVMQEIFGVMDVSALALDAGDRP